MSTILDGAEMSDPAAIETSSTSGVVVDHVSPELYNWAPAHLTDQTPRLLATGVFAHRVLTGRRPIHTTSTTFIDRDVSHEVWRNASVSAGPGKGRREWCRECDS